MGITIYRLKDHCEQEVKPLDGEAMQVKVSCQGDIAVQPFYPGDCDGVAWLLLSEGPEGEPGREINGEVDEGPRLLAEQPGVLIGATDPRSLNVIIAALMSLRDRLEIKQSDLPLVAISRRAREDIEAQEDEATLRGIEDALRPDQPLGRALGTAISEQLDQAIIDSLYEGDVVEQEVQVIRDPTGGMGFTETTLPGRVTREDARDEEEPKTTPWGKVTQ